MTEMGRSSSRWTTLTPRRPARYRCTATTQQRDLGFFDHAAHRSFSGHPLRVPGAAWMDGLELNSRRGRPSHYAKAAPGAWMELPNVSGESHRFDEIEPELRPVTTGSASTPACMSPRRGSALSPSPHADVCLHLSRLHLSRLRPKNLAPPQGSSDPWTVVSVAAARQCSDRRC